METITFQRNISYTDTREHLEFWARAKGWEPETVISRHSETGEPIEVVQNDLVEFINNYFDTLIKNEMTAPVKQEVDVIVDQQIAVQAQEMREALKAQKEAEILSRLTIE